MSPGSIKTALIFIEESSSLRESVRASTAYFEAWYQPKNGEEKRPAIDEMFMILEEGDFFIYGITSCVRRIRANTFTSNCFFACSIGTFSIEPPRP